jgi:hypothetical protein
MIVSYPYKYTSKKYCATTDMVVGIVYDPTTNMYHAAEWDGIGTEPVQGPDDCRLVAQCYECDEAMPDVVFYFSRNNVGTKHVCDACTAKAEKYSYHVQERKRDA